MKHTRRQFMRIAGSATSLICGNLFSSSNNGAQDPRTERGTDKNRILNINENTPKILDNSGICYDATGSGDGPTAADANRVQYLKQEDPFFDPYFSHFFDCNSDGQVDDREKYLFQDKPKVSGFEKDSGRQEWDDPSYTRKIGLVTTNTARQGFEGTESWLDSMKAHQEFLWSYLNASSRAIRTESSDGLRINNEVNVIDDLTLDLLDSGQPYRWGELGSHIERQLDKLFEQDDYDSAIAFIGGPDTDVDIRGFVAREYPLKDPSIGMIDSLGRDIADLQGEPKPLHPWQIRLEYDISSPRVAPTFHETVHTLTDSGQPRNKSINGQGKTMNPSQTEHPWFVPAEDYTLAMQTAMYGPDSDATKTITTPAISDPTLDDMIRYVENQRN